MRDGDVRIPLESDIDRAQRMSAKCRQQQTFTMRRLRRVIRHAVLDQEGCRIETKID
jgi:hypothetical protein